MKHLLLLFLLFFSLNSFSQRIIDTVFINGEKVFIKSNHTWIYEKDLNFNGILNEYVHQQIASDTSLNYIYEWNHEECFPSDFKNDPNKLKDTIWLCLKDSVHGGFVMPFNGRVTSHFGWRRGRMHNGTDIDLVTGDTVRAAFSGKIRYAKYNTGGFGNLVIIRHYNGLETLYAHLSQMLVVPNQEVKAGDPIGLGGNTGRSYGSHLHFETRFYDIPIDPEKLIDFKKGVLKDDNLLVHKKLFHGTARSSYTTSSSGGRKYYRIRSGDTLSSIARRNGTTVSRLCQLNGIRPTSILRVGKTLRVK